jgi:hypothetical protein
MVGAYRLECQRQSDMVDMQSDSSRANITNNIIPYLYLPKTPHLTLHSIL